MEINLDINKYFNSKITYKDERDEMIKKSVSHINSLREAQGFQYTNKYQKVIKLKPETPASLAKKINLNPFLAGNSKNGELKEVLKQCREKGNYAYLYSLLKVK